MELDELQEGIRVNQLGEDEYESQKSLMKLLAPSDDGSEEKQEIILYNKTIVLDEYLSEIGNNAQDIYILCVGCCFDALFVKLDRFFRSLSTPWSFDHYIAYTTRNIVSSVCSLLPMLRMDQYQLFISKEHANAQDDVNYGNHLFIQCRKNDRMVCHHIVMLSKKTGYAFTITGEELIKFHRTISNAPFSFMKTKQQFADTETNHMDFLTACYLKEKNRSVYQLRPDLCFEHIHPKYAFQALKPSCNIPTEINDTAKMLYHVCMQRYNNAFSKQKMNHLIVTAAGMQAFAKTGLLSDHPVILREFTPTERKDILSNILDQIVHSSFFTLSVLKSDIPIPVHQLICYNQLGVLLTTESCNYDLLQDYSEVYLPIPELSRGMIQFFFNLMTKNIVMDAKKTKEFLANLIKSIV